MDKEIFILTHKKIDMDIDLDRYNLLQIGADLSNENIYLLKDNFGDNISNKNKTWLELTGVYWIWKNCNAYIKGYMQYRRFLSIYPNFVERVLENYDLITANYAIIDKISVYDHYRACHNIEDLDHCKDIIDRYHPEYSESFDKYIKNNNILFYSNSLITRKELYDDACTFLFDVLDRLEKEYLYTQELIDKSARKAAINNCTGGHDISSFEYNQRIFSLLYERLSTLYIFHNKLKVYTCGPYICLEDGIQ